MNKLIMLCKNDKRIMDYILLGSTFLFLLLSLAFDEAWMLVWWVCAVPGIYMMNTMRQMIHYIRIMFWSAFVVEVSCMLDMIMNPGWLDFRWSAYQNIGVFDVVFLLTAIVYIFIRFHLHKEKLDDEISSSGRKVKNIFCYLWLMVSIAISTLLLTYRFSYLEDSSWLDGQSVIIQCEDDDKYALTIYDGKLQIDSITCASNQIFTLNQVGECYKITAYNHDNIDVKEANFSEGNEVLMWFDNGNTNQQWHIRSDGNGGFFIEAFENGLLMSYDVDGHGEAFRLANSLATERCIYRFINVNKVAPSLLSRMKIVIDGACIWGIIIIGVIEYIAMIACWVLKKEK